MVEALDVIRIFLFLDADPICVSKNKNIRMASNASTIVGGVG